METEDTNNDDELQECTYCYHLYSPNDREGYSFEEDDSGLCQKCGALQERKCKNCDNVYSPNDKEGYSFEEGDSGLCPECEAETDKDYHQKNEIVDRLK